MNEDFLDLLSALNDAEVRFLVVGAYAVGVQTARQPCPGSVAPTAVREPLASPQNADAITA